MLWAGWLKLTGFRRTKKMPANLLFAAYFLIRDKKRCICAYCQYRNKNIQTTLILCAFFLLFCYYISLLLAFKAQSKLYKMCKSQLISILHYKSVCDGLKFSSSSKLFAEGPSRNFCHPASLSKISFLHITGFPPGTASLQTPCCTTLWPGWTSW